MLLNISRSYRSRWSYLLAIFLHRWQRIVPLLLIFYFSLLIIERKHLFTRHAHTITDSSIAFTTSQLSSSNPPSSAGAGNKDILYLSPSSAETFCRAHRFPALPSPKPTSPPTSSPPPRRRKVYDLFLLNTELDFLEIRLSTLYPVVDYFIIVESPVTFTLREKPLVLKDNWARYAPYHDKIIHHVLTDPPMHAKRTWDVEDFQRNAMFTQTFGTLEGEKKAEIGDVIVVSDVDEIPRPAMMLLLRNCEIPRRVTIRSQFYYYGFQWKYRGVEWGHGQATLYAGQKGTILPKDLRNGEGGGWNWFGVRRWWESVDVWNAGWHCSTCFERVEDVLGKMGSFSHILMNQEGFRDRERIVDRVRSGRDLWDRKWQLMDKVENNEDIPDILKTDRQRWSYLLVRDGQNAGFTDYQGGLVEGG